MADLHLLVTGFGPFPDVPSNPTAWLVEDLRAWQPTGFALVTHVLDVTYDVWENALAPLIEKHRPDAVVAFGYSAKAAGFTVESTARNVLDPSRPDVRGALPLADRISSDGPDTYASTLRFSHPYAVSHDAGSYVCNLTLYRLLENRVAATFVHLPRMPHEQLRKSARLILEAAASSVKAGRPSAAT